ncbi:MAG: hypothetical protein FWF03_00275, partial [Defluviitaleaceae bacterium]|nr:hypothetical protein [Defluviitaleaceae bacterium]
ELAAITALTPTPEAPAITKLTPAEAAVNAQAPMAQIEPARQGIVPPNSEAAASAVFPAAINETPNTRDGAETALRLLVDVLTRMDVLQNNAGTRRQSEAPGRADLQKIGAGLAFRLRGSVPGDIERFVNSMREALQTARQTLAETRAETAGAGDSSRFARAAWQLTQHLDFISQLKNHLYVQLPLHVDGRETLAELHVFKDAKKDKKSQGGAKSALVALDTAYLGHFEAFVLKNGESIGCQFRLRDEAVERLVKNNLGKLEKSLRGCGLSLDSFSFLPNGEPYRLPSPPPAADGNRAAPAVKSKLGIDVKA